MTWWDAEPVGAVAGVTNASGGEGQGYGKPMSSTLDGLLHTVVMPVRLAVGVLSAPADWLATFDDAATAAWEPFLTDDDR